MNLFNRWTSVQRVGDESKALCMSPLVSFFLWQLAAKCVLCCIAFQLVVGAIALRLEATASRLEASAICLRCLEAVGLQDTRHTT